MAYSTHGPAARGGEAGAAFGRSRAMPGSAAPFAKPVRRCWVLGLRSVAIESKVVHDGVHGR
eukprot:scaffold14576_cov132-Isochrysis_galbana.AAC.3